MSRARLRRAAAKNVAPATARHERRAAPFSVQGLTKHYGSRVGCEDVTFDLWQGKVLAVVGESGSGKMNGLSCLWGDLAPTRGTIAYRTRDRTVREADRLSHVERRVLQRTDRGIVRQNAVDGLRMGVSAGGNAGQRLMAIGARHYGEIRQAAADWLARVETATARIDEHPTRFFGGARGCLEIARDLVTRPRLLLMDEPTSGLDVSVQARLMDVLRSLARDRGLSVVIATHDLAMARLLSDRIMVMQKDQVLDDPRRAYAQLRVSSVLQVA